MRGYRVKPINRLEGEIDLAGDKSICHRAIMIGSIAEGSTEIGNFANSQDCLRTVDAFRQMGIDINIEGSRVTVVGKGLHGLKKPKGPLYLGNSGTTMRLILGILAGQAFDCTLTGDRSLSSRPMSRVTHPLRKMGAKIEGKDEAEFAPLAIKGGKLKPISYQTPIPSAQVKSAILFAGLYADGITSVEERLKSRDHTERMLKWFGADLKVDRTSVFLKGGSKLLANKIQIPGDISGASFFIVGATLLKGSSVGIKSVLCNPTRIGILGVLQDMGADIDIANKKVSGFEPTCDLHVTSSELRGIDIAPDMIPSIIDEIPAIMVAAALAKGRTVIRGAGELRVKETDRISSITTNLKNMGVGVTVQEDDIIIEGAEELKASELDSFGDHRTAMSMVIAALAAKETSTISDVKCIDTSFPDFFDVLKTLTSN